LFHNFKTVTKQQIQYFLFIILTVLLLIQIIFSNYQFNRQLMASYNHLKSSIVQNQIVADELLKENITKIVANISNDADALSILSGPTDYLDRALSFRTLNKYIDLINEISVVYLYSHNYKTLYSSTNSGQSLEDFAVLELQDELSKPRETRNSFVLVKNKYSDKCRYFLIYSVNHRSDDAIIIELDYELLRQRYSKCQKELSGQFLVYFSDGITLFGGTDFSIGSKITNEQLISFRETLENNKTITYNGRHHLITTYYSKYLDNYYTFLTPTSNIYRDKAFFKQYLYLCTSIVISAFLMLFVFLLFKRMTLWLKIFKTREFPSSHKPEDNSIFLMDYMLNPNEDNASKIKSYLPQDIIYSSKVFCLLITIDDHETFKKKYSQSDIKLFLFAFDNIIQEIWGDLQFDLYKLTDTPKKLAYAMNYHGNDMKTSYQQAALKCQETLRDYLDIHTSCFLSSEGTLSKLYDAYEQVHMLRKYQFIYGKNCILDCSAISDDNVDFKEGKLHLKKMKSYLDTGNPQYKLSMDALFSILPRLQVNHLHEILVRLLIYIDEIDTKADISSDSISAHIVMNDLLGGRKYLSDVMDYLSKRIGSLINAGDEPSNNNLMLTIDKCKVIIEQEYTDQSLCVEKIADKLGFSTNYLGRKFREYEGHSIADALKEKRLNAATDLIVNTNESIKDIITKSGFVSPSHFNSAFKAKYGCSPTTYRVRYTKTSD